MAKNSHEAPWRKAVGAIYDAALDRRQWPSALESVYRVCGGVAAQMSVRMPDGRESFGCVSGIPPETHSEYIENYASVDIRFRRLASLPKAVVYRESDLITPEERARSPVYNELLPKYDLNAVMVADLPVLDDLAFFSVLGPGSLERFDRGAAETLRALLPHLRRSVEIQARLACAEEEQLATYEGLDALPIGIVFLDERGGVRFANRRALQMAADANVRIKKSGIEVSAGSARDSLARMIGRALRSAAGKELSAGGIVPLRHGRESLVLRIVPLPSARSSSREGPWSKVATMAIIGRAGLDRPVGADALKSLYGLTATEADIGARLLVGQALQTIADERGVSLHTVRTQSKALFEKSGTGRQPEFVARAWAALSGLVDPRGD